MLKMHLCIALSFKTIPSTESRILKTYLDKLFNFYYLCLVYFSKPTPSRVGDRRAIKSLCAAKIRFFVSNRSICFLDCHSGLSGIVVFNKTTILDALQKSALTRMTFIKKKFSFIFTKSLDCISQHRPWH